MKKSKLMNKLLTADIEFEKHSRNYRRLILLNVLLYVTMSLTATFILINIFIVHSYLIALMDAVVFCFIAYASYHLHTNKKPLIPTYIFIGSIFSFLLAFALVNQNNHFGLIWTVFLPLVSFLLLDRNKSLILVGVFYIFLFYFAYIGIGSWQDGDWCMLSLLRFMAASIAFSCVIYFMEYSHELAEIQLAIAREKDAENIKYLRELTILDSLTKLHNRRYLQEVFPKSFQTAQRHKDYFAFYILDIDYFKQYNDTYGHQQGDVALCLLSDALKAYMRRSEDLVCRLGGEEFCGIFVCDDEAKIHDQLNALMESIKALNISHKGSFVSKLLTVSMGVKIINNYDKFNFDNLYKEADEALYKAKVNGRNQIVFSSLG